MQTTQTTQTRWRAPHQGGSRSRGGGDETGERGTCSAVVAGGETGMPRVGWRERALCDIAKFAIGAGGRQRGWPGQRCAR